MAEDASGRSSARMQRVVIDTNVYIDWINEGQYEAVLFQRDSVKYLSAVVIMELSAGAFSVRDRRLVREVTSAFAKVGRILLPRFRSTKTQARCCVGFRNLRVIRWPALTAW